MTRILIVGATGVLGSAATKYLLENNYSVRALVRNESKAKELEKAGAEIFVGDLTNPGSIIKACNKVDVIITAAHGMLGKGKNRSRNIDDIGHRNLIDSAVKAGVKLFIYSSLHGAAKEHPVDFFRTKYEIEQYLIRSGLTYTILSLPAFMEWHVHNLLGKSIKEKGKATILGTGNNPTNFIAVEDIVQALKIIVEDETYHNKIIPIAGPENLSRNEVANLYGKLLNITPRITHVPGYALKFLSKLITPLHPGIGTILKFSAYSETADATMNTAYNIEQFGLRPTTIESFVKKQLGSQF